MIHLRVASDLHLDSYRPKESTELAARIFAGSDYDVAVIAGDVANFSALSDMLSKLLAAIPQNTPVVYVLGNHEHYGAPSEAAVHALVKDTAREHRDFHLLAGDTVTLSGVRFLGTTLWYENNALIQSIVQERDWPDFRHIPYVAASLDAWNQRERALVDRALDETDVVVSHLLPHPVCIAPPFAGNPTNAFFVNDQSERLQKAGERAPRLWLFGHTHEWIDEQVGPTRLFARPIGYRKEHTLRNSTADLAKACTVSLA